MRGTTSLLELFEAEMGFRKCRSDLAMFARRDDRANLRGLMIVHVDDVMYCHDDGELGRLVEQKMTKRFPFGTWMRVHEQASGVTYC